MTLWDVFEFLTFKSSEWFLTFLVGMIGYRFMKENL